jgi:ATP-binding cassette subfamily B protein
MFTNTLIIRAANKEEEASQHFDTLITDLYKISKKSSFIGSLAGPMFSITNSIILILVVIFATLLKTVGGNGSGITALPSFILFIGMFNSPFSTISGNIQNLLGVSVCLNRIFDLLEEEEIVPEPPFSHTPKNNDIVFDHVSFGYKPNQMIIKDFNLSIPFGKTIAIVGTTGSGKSTLVNLLMRFYEVTSGKIEIGSVNITDINREKLRDMFSMVLQEP